MKLTQFGQMYALIKSQRLQTGELQGEFNFPWYSSDLQDFQSLFTPFQQLHPQIWGKLNRYQSVDFKMKLIIDVVHKLVLRLGLSRDCVLAEIIIIIFLYLWQIIQSQVIQFIWLCSSDMLQFSQPSQTQNFKQPWYFQTPV